MASKTGTNNQKISKLFVYGTLMTKTRHGAPLGTKYLGEATLKGSLYDLQSYPGYKIDGNTIIKGELLDVSDEAWPGLDAYEGYHHQSPNNSLYVRTLTRTEEGDLCYVYVYNHHVNDKFLIKSGDWKNK